MRRGSSSRPDVVVVGAGVSGLTTAVRLAEDGLWVRIIAMDEPAATSSAAAGAIWDPTYAKHPHLIAWANRTYEVFSAMATAGLSAIRMVDAIEASRRAFTPPSSAYQLPGFRRCVPDELPADFISGYRYRAPIIDMPPYLRTLSDRVTAADGEQLYGVRLNTLSEALSDADVVVNCTGLGARDLVPDPHVVPIRGQLVAVRNPGLEDFFADHTDMPDEMTYLLPHGDVLLLGSSTEAGRSDQRPTKDVAAAILERGSRIFPAIADAEVLGYRAGIRPSRTEVRLELSAMGQGQHVVHNYGHGGSGVSLSWGCAEEVLSLVRDVLGRA